MACSIAGCGYKSPEDKIDPTAGLECFVKVGSEVNRGDPLFRIFNSNKAKLTAAVEKLKQVTLIGEDQKIEPLIYV